MTGVQTCALPICQPPNRRSQASSRLIPQWNLAPCSRLIPRWTRLNPEGHSLLEPACEKARDAKLPCLLFFKAPGSNGASSAATDTDARQVAAFRSRLQRKILVVHSFSTPDELREQLRSSLAQLRSELDARASKARPTQRRATPKRRAPIK